MEPRARPVNDIFLDLKRFLEAYSGNQSELAKQAGVDPSTISRAMHSARRARLSGPLRELCTIANISLVIAPTALRPDPSSSPELMEALSEVWDGSQSHAKVISKLLRDLRMFADGRKD